MFKKSKFQIVARFCVLIVFAVILQVSQVSANHFSPGCELNGYVHDNPGATVAWILPSIEYYGGEELTFTSNGPATSITLYHPTGTIVLLIGDSYTYSVTVDSYLAFRLENNTASGFVGFELSCQPAPGREHEEDSPELEDPSPAFHDGRFNNFDTGSPVVLFTVVEDEENWHLDVYAADGSGLLFTVSAEAINSVEACPESNTLIYEDSASGISFWRLAEESDGTCPYQLNAPTGEPGKWYIITFYEPNGSYESWTEFIGS